MPAELPFEGWIERYAEAGTGGLETRAARHLAGHVRGEQSRAGEADEADRRRERACQVNRRRAADGRIDRIGEHDSQPQLARAPGERQRRSWTSEARELQHRDVDRSRGGESLEIRRALQRLVDGEAYAGIGPKTRELGRLARAQRLLHVLRRESREGLERPARFVEAPGAIGIEPNRRAPAAFAPDPREPRQI